jgi:hypothetical protein
MNISAFFTYIFSATMVQSFFYQVQFRRTQPTQLHTYSTRTRTCMRPYTRKKRLGDVASSARETRSTTEHAHVRVP